jgi:hypothetical protein
MPDVSEVRGQYLVLSDDGEQYGPYDDKKQAAAKYRELQKEENGGEDMNGQEQSRAQRAATKFASGVNTAARKAGEAGRNLAEKADQKAQQAAEEGSDSSGGPSLPSGGMGGGSGPSMDMFGGGGSDSPDMGSLPFGESEGNDPDLGFLDGGDGEPQMPMFGSGGEGDGPTMPDFGGGGPDMGQLPFGGMESEDDEEEPQNPMDYF